MSRVTEFSDDFDAYLANVDSCPCGRDSLGDLGEPAEHDDGCPIWERARAEVSTYLDKESTNGK